MERDLTKDKNGGFLVLKNRSGVLGIMVIVMLSYPCGACIFLFLLKALCFSHQSLIIERGSEVQNPSVDFHHDQSLMTFVKKNG